MKAILVVMIFWGNFGHGSTGGGPAMHTQLLPTMGICNKVAESIRSKSHIMATDNHSGEMAAYCVDIEDKGQ